MARLSVPSLAVCASCRQLMVEGYKGHLFCSNVECELNGVLHDRCGTRMGVDW